MFNIIRSFLRDIEIRTQRMSIFRMNSHFDANNSEKNVRVRCASQPAEGNWTLFAIDNVY